MKPVVFRESALADLEALASFFDAIDPDVTSRIVADIEGSIARLAHLPLSGEAIPHTDLRRIASRRYRFTISYFAAPDQVEIVGVFRFQNRAS